MFLSFNLESIQKNHTFNVSIINILTFIYLVNQNLFVMKKIFLAILSISAFSIVLITSCKKDKTSAATPTVECDTAVVISFATDISPIIEMNCATSGCHDQSSAADGRIYSDGAGNASHPLISAAANSANFMGSMNHESGFSAMPDGSPKLTDDQLTKLQCWINNGKPNN